MSMMLCVAGYSSVPGEESNKDLLSFPKKSEKGNLGIIHLRTIPTELFTYYLIINMLNANINILNIKKAGGSENAKKPRFR
ncbi:MAG: hypothetical protein ACOX1I_00460 [Dethiobacteria bacterium]